MHRHGADVLRVDKINKISASKYNTRYEWVCEDGVVKILFTQLNKI